MSTEEEIKLLVKKGEIYYADLTNNKGCAQGGVRPVLIVQNDIGNLHSPTVVVAAMTSKSKKPLGTHFLISKENTGLKCDSTVMMEQVFTIDKSQLKSRVGQIDLESYKKDMFQATMISFGFLETYLDLKNKLNNRNLQFS